MIATWENCDIEVLQKICKMQHRIFKWIIVSVGIYDKLTLYFRFFQHMWDGAQNILNGVIAMVWIHNKLTLCFDWSGLWSPISFWSKCVRQGTEYPEWDVTSWFTFMQNWLWTTVDNLWSSMRLFAANIWDAVENILNETLLRFLCM